MPSDLTCDVAAVVLAAGQGTRFASETNGAFKLLARHRDVPLVRHVAEAALAARARPVVVVTGHRRDEVMTALAGLPVQDVHNPNYPSGLASSLAAGVAALPAEAKGALILLADMPLVSVALIERLIATFDRDPNRDAVVPTFRGARGNPVLLGAAMFPAVLRLTGDEGARRILKGATRVAEVPFDDRSVTLDIDTPDALRALEHDGL